jgi:hypothetical protein
MIGRVYRRSERQAAGQGKFTGNKSCPQHSYDLVMTMARDRNRTEHWCHTDNPTAANAEQTAETILRRLRFPCV